MSRLLRTLWAAVLVASVGIAPALAQNISSLPAASSAGRTDILPATQGSVGPNTGTTRKVTLAQAFAAMNNADIVTALGYTPVQPVATSPLVGSNGTGLTAVSVGIGLGMSGTVLSLSPPTTLALGGVQAVVPVLHQWINSINTSGVPALSQPAASDITGLAASATTDTTNASNIVSGTLGAARLPNPSSTTLGGIQSAVGVSHQWISSISTGGVPALSQPVVADVSGLPTIFSRLTAPRRIVWMGDSTFRRSSTDPSTATGSPSWNVHGSISWFRTLVNGRIDIDLGDNQAKGGTTLVEEVNDPTLVDAALAGMRPGDILVMGGGTNDIVSSVPNTFAQITAALQLLLQKCQAVGVQLVLVTPGARNNWLTNDTGDQYPVFQQLRRWEMEFGRQNNVKVIDLWATTNQPGTNPPMSNTGWGMLDGVHQNTQLALNEGYLFLRELNEYLPSEMRSALAMSNLDLAPGTAPFLNTYGPLISGTMMNGTAGSIAAGTGGITITGELASAFSASAPATALTGDVVYSKEVDPDGYNVQVVTFTGVSGGGKKEGFNVITQQGNGDSRWATGDQVREMVSICVTGPAHSVTAQLVSTGVTDTQIANSHNSLDDPDIAATVNTVGANGTTMTLTLTATGVVGSPFAFNHVVAPGDTPTTVAADWDAQINGTAALTSAGYSSATATDTTTITAPSDIGYPNVNVVYTTDGAGAASVTFPPGQYGNLPKASVNTPPVCGLFTTPWMTLGTIDTASTLRMSVLTRIDSTLSPANDNNVVQVRMKRMGVFKKPIN